MTRNLIRIPEPTLMFRHAQAVEDPRDGLTLFGPLDQAKPYGIRAGIIGTREGIEAYKKWVPRIIRPVACVPPIPSRPPFPGFEAAFQIPWNASPVLELVVEDREIDAAIYQSDRHQRVYKAVDLFAERLICANRDEDAKADLWFVVIPDRVRQHCRPRSSVQRSVRIESEHVISAKAAVNVQDAPFMFAEMNEASEPYQFEPHFHNQLKSRLLADKVLTQIIQHKTISDPAKWADREKKSLAKMQSQIAWNLSTAAFYKSGGRPWKLNGIRPGVCYVGVVFKQDERAKDIRNACCAAQMFLDSGDGVVFKGAVGPWYNPTRGDYHLSRRAAKELIGVALKSYRERFDTPPTEMFIHGRVRFGDEEWMGFLDAAGKSTKVVGVTIGEGERLKLFSTSSIPVLRGMAWVGTERSAYLWTRGFVPRLRTYPGLEVPNPLHVAISRGEADILTVLADIMALTKLNYNACIYADGLPVTLKFANAVGEILTAGPVKGTPPLPFKHYI
jgi:hypothetical protein